MKTAYSNMKKYMYCLFLATFSISTLSCKNSNRQKIGNTAQQSPQTEKSVQQEPQFPYPKIPESLKDPESRKTFLLAHYWDEFNFADTALVNTAMSPNKGLSTTSPCLPIRRRIRMKQNPASGIYAGSCTRIRTQGKYS